MEAEVYSWSSLLLFGAIYGPRNSRFESRVSLLGLGEHSESFFRRHRKNVALSISELNPLKYVAFIFWLTSFELVKVHVREMCYGGSCMRFSSSGFKVAEGNIFAFFNIK